MYSPGLRLVRLLSKRYAFLLGPQPVGHLEFLTKMAQVPVSSAVNYVNVIKKEYQEYQQEKGLTSQDAQDEQYEQYSNPNIKDDSLFTVPLDFESLPFVELGLINAREIGSGKFLDARIIHILPLNRMMKLARLVPLQTANVRLCSFADALLLGYGRIMPGYTLPATVSLDPGISISRQEDGFFAFDPSFDCDARANNRRVSIDMDLHFVVQYRDDVFFVRLYFLKKLGLCIDRTIRRCANEVICDHLVDWRWVMFDQSIAPHIFQLYYLLFHTPGLCLCQDSDSEDQDRHTDSKSNAFHLPLLDWDEIIKLPQTRDVKPSFAQTSLPTEEFYSTQVKKALRSFIEANLFGGGVA
jgi:hypothetical protein